MKTFENKITEITNQVSEKEVKNLGYVDLALLGLRLTPEGGWDIEDMRQRFKLIDKLVLVDIGTDIELEDAEFDLIESTTIKKWAIMHKDVIAYSDYINSLK